MRVMTVETHAALGWHVLRLFVLHHFVALETDFGFFVCQLELVLFRLRCLVTEFAGRRLAGGFVNCALRCQVIVTRGIQAALAFVNTVRWVTLAKACRGRGQADKPEQQQCSHWLHDNMKPRMSDSSTKLASTDRLKLLIIINQNPGFLDNVFPYSGQGIYVLVLSC